MTAGQNAIEENQGVKANDAEMVMVPVEVGQGGKIPLSLCLVSDPSELEIGVPRLASKASVTFMKEGRKSKNSAFTALFECL